MVKAHLNYLSFGFLLILVFSEIRYACSAGNTCVGGSTIRVTNCKTGCGEVCSELNIKGPSRCIETTVSAGGGAIYTKYECECCKCTATADFETSSCINSPQRCVEKCFKEGYDGPSQCKEFYEDGWKYVHKCYCCGEKQYLTAGNSVIVA